MPLRFDASARPSAADYEQLEALGPANPFWTRRYMEALGKTGLQTWVLGLRDPQSGTLAAGCTAVLRSGRLNRRLEIMSWAEVEGHDGFWAGLRDFCREQRIGFAKLDAWGWTGPARLPAMRGEVERTTRSEYIIDLRDGEFAKAFCSGHRYSVKRACKTGVTITRTRDAAALAPHLELIGASLGRRRERGEKVPGSIQAAMLQAFLKTGAGELFQAVKDGQVLTSMLALRSATAAYDQSMGTSAEGMRCGSSILAVAEAARIFKEEGCAYFNLGAAEAGSGLAYFKTGFGARPVEQDSVQLCLCGAWRRGLTLAAARIQEWTQSRRGG